MPRLYMPYVKYRGARPPNSIKKHVSYQDPKSPCYDGLAELMAEARRFSEAESKNANEMETSIAQYVRSHPNPGLDQMGGIGFVEANAVGPTDEVISDEEYRRVQFDINKANEESRKRRAANLSRDND